MESDCVVVYMAPWLGLLLDPSSRCTMGKSAGILLLGIFDDPVH